MIRKLLVNLIWKNPLSRYGRMPSQKLILRLLAVLVILLTIYAPVELTRVVVTSILFIGKLEVLRNIWQIQVAEVAFIWVSYTIAVVLVWKLAKEGD